MDIETLKRWRRQLLEEEDELKQFKKIKFFHRNC